MIGNCSAGCGGGAVYRALCAGFVGACLLAYPLADLAAGERGAAYILLHLLLTALMLAAWARATGKGIDIRWTLAAAITARVALVAAPAVTSHDADRYLWDGRVLVEGLDPYRTAPRDPEVAHLHAQFTTPPEHAALPTLYPPAALALFAVAAALGPVGGFICWKLLLCAASSLLLWPAVYLLRRKRCERHLPLVAFSPLLVLEGGVGAHLDILVAAAVALALWAFYRGRHPTCGVSVGLATLLKLSPVLLLLPLALAMGRKQAGRLIACAVGTIAAGYGAAVAVGLRPLGSLPVFVERWRFGSPVGAALENLFGSATGVVTAALLLAGLAVAGLWASRGRVLPAVFATLALPWLLGPVAFPWYLTPLVVPLAAAPTGFGLAWLSITPLTYEVIDAFDAAGCWQPAAWPLWLIACGFAVGLYIDAQRRQVRRLGPRLAAKGRKQDPL